MIWALLGVVDLIAACLIYFGDVFGPDTFTNIIVGILIIKGIWTVLSTIGG